MDKYIYDENNDLWYELQGDYYIPCLTLLKEEQQPIGIWGRNIFYISISTVKSCIIACCSAESSMATLPI